MKPSEIAENKRECRRRLEGAYSRIVEMAWLMTKSGIPSDWNEFECNEARFLILTHRGSLPIEPGYPQNLENMSQALTLLESFMESSGFNKDYPG